MTTTPNIILRGGPEIPESERLQFVPDTGKKLKLFRGHRYDHFEPTDQTLQHSGWELRVFLWTGSTYVAE
jgi:hypothetical protein